MAYRVEYKESVARDLKRIDRKEAARLLNKLERELRTDLRAGEHLSGKFRGLWKLRVGEYRVIYIKTESGALVLRIGHRKNIYDR